MFGPLLLAEYTETEWPEALVLDSTRFMTTNSWTGSPTERYAGSLRV